jgi:hypothetical protein
MQDIVQLWHTGLFVESKEAFLGEKRGFWVEKRAKSGLSITDW